MAAKGFPTRLGFTGGRVKIPSPPRERARPPAAKRSSGPPAYAIRRNPESRGNPRCDSPPCPIGQTVGSAPAARSNAATPDRYTPWRAGTPARPSLHRTRTPLPCRLSRRSGRSQVSWAFSFLRLGRKHEGIALAAAGFRRARRFGLGDVFRVDRNNAGATPMGRHHHPIGLVAAHAEFSLEHRDDELPWRVVVVH